MDYITIKCNKDLVNMSGHKDFTKGEEYVAEVYQYNKNQITENTTVVSDDAGCRHILGNWHKHFKIVK